MSIERVSFGGAILRVAASLRNPARQGGPLVAAQGVLPPAEDPGASESPQNRLVRLMRRCRETWHDFMSDPTETHRAADASAYEAFLDAVLELPFLRDDELLGEAPHEAEIPKSRERAAVMRRVLDKIGDEL